LLCLLGLVLARRVLPALLILYATAALAQPAPLNGRDGIALWPAATMLSDPGRALDAPGAWARRDEFRPPSSPQANLGPRSDAVWLRVPLQVPHTELGRWVLDIDYAALDRVDVWDADSLLKLADAALYAGKSAGKRRVLGVHQMRADTERFRAPATALQEA
jgi:hypothetical protein